MRSFLSRAVVYPIILGLIAGACLGAIEPQPAAAKAPETMPVAEPAAIALLSAGLVSLAIYAKRRQSKKP